MASSDVLALHGNWLHAMKPTLRHVLAPSTAFAKNVLSCYQQLLMRSSEGSLLLRFGAATLHFSLQVLDKAAAGSSSKEDHRKHKSRSDHKEHRHLRSACALFGEGFMCLPTAGMQANESTAKLAAGTAVSGPNAPCLQLSPPRSAR